MNYQRKRVAKRLASGLLAGALALGGLAISGGTASAVTPATTGNRIEGTDRYSTSVALATRYLNVLTVNNTVAANWGGNLVFASGGNFPDGLAAASIASVRKAPIILVPSDGSLPSSVRDWLLINRSAIQGKTAPTITVVGGTSAVADATVTAALAVLNEGLTSPKVSSTRLSGADRYATAAAVNGATGVMGGTDRAIIVSGENFADAISAAPLAFANGWPIILTPTSGLNASALATVSAFVTASSSDSFIIVGGKSAVSETVETQLVEAGIPYANITRIAGADRYLTSAALNAYMLPSGLNLPANMFTGANVALVSGENFADAIASAPFLAADSAAGKGIHIQLTASGSLSTGAAGLIATLAAAASPANVYIIGGTSAVSAATAAAAVATAQSTNMVGTMTCPEGSTKVRITFPNALDATEDNTGVLTDADLSINGASNATTADATFSTDMKTAIFTVPALVAGQTVTFGGNPEASSATKRSLSAGACTVTDDAVGPTATVTIAAPDATNGDKDAFVVSFSEPVAYDATASLANNAAGKFDTHDISIFRADGTTAVTYAPANAGSSIVALDAAAGFASKFLVSVHSGTAAIDFSTTTNGFVVKVNADATNGPKDLAGNTLAATASGSIAAAATASTVKATFTSAVTCLAATQATVTAGGITLTATALGAFDGAAGNGWKLSVVNKRGQVLPSVAVDAAAKTVVVTADVQYTNGADLLKYISNNGLLAGWTVAAGGALTSTAVAGPGTTANGTDACVITMTSDQVLQAAPTATATVNGVAVAAPTATLETNKTTLTWTAITAGLDGSTIVLTVGAVRNLAGVNSTPGSITLTTT